jgi:quinol monooxygenase YgiN
MGMRKHLGVAVLVLPWLQYPAQSQPPISEQQGGVVVRIAELEIDPAQLQAYLAVVKEEMNESIRIEPGVLAIYSVAEKDNPTRLRFFEIDADDAAYRSHIASPHFRKYVAVTQSMITARKLIETTPIQLSAKSK